MEIKSVAIENMRNEVAAAQKLLDIQIEMNNKAQDHIMLLDSEVNSLRDLAESKQLTINKLKAIIIEKDSEIERLKTIIDNSNITKKAFDELDGVNNLLLAKFKEREKQIEQLQLELSIERNMKEDKALYEENRIKKVAAMEIILTSQLSDLQNRFDKSQAELSEKSSRVEKLSASVKALEEKLRWSEYMRLDQVARSRQSEYRSLSKLEDVTNNFYRTLNEKEILESTVQVQSVRGDMLQVLFFLGG